MLGAELCLSQVQSSPGRLLQAAAEAGKAETLKGRPLLYPGPRHYSTYHAAAVTPDFAPLPSPCVIF